MEPFHLLPSWIHPLGSKKRQVMNPTMGSCAISTLYFLQTSAIETSSSSSSPSIGPSQWHCQCPNFTITGSLQSTGLGLSPFLPLTFTLTLLLTAMSILLLQAACAMHFRWRSSSVFSPLQRPRSPHRAGVYKWQVGAENPT